MSYEAVLFDLDGTLYPYEPAETAGREAAFRRAGELGYDFDRETFTTVYETGRRAVKRQLAGVAATHDRFGYFERGLARHTGDPEPADAHALGTAYWDAFCERMAPFAELRPTLDRLAATNTAVAVTTNMQTRVQLRKLTTLGVGDAVDTVVTSEMTGREKPGAAMVTLPLARLDYPPSEAVIVGDNPATDIAAAAGLPLDSVLFDHTHTHGDGETADDSLPSARRPDY
ncbi:MAG: putative hydrolase (HAD superfamily), partial [halophilic archaeon J07HB67]